MLQAPVAGMIPCPSAAAQEKCVPVQADGEQHIVRFAGNAGSDRWSFSLTVQVGYRCPKLLSGFCTWRFTLVEDVPFPD